MKIKVINPNTNSAMTAKIGEAASAVAASGTEIVAAQPAMGPLTIDTAYDNAFAAIGVIDEVRRGEREGCDAYVIACFGDPGVSAAREVARGPVIGMGEAAMQAASMIAGGFSIVSMPERSRADMIRRVQACGMAHLCRSIRLVDVTVLESEDDSEARARLAAECRRAVTEDHADCVLLGCSGLTDLAARISLDIGAPAIDGVTIAVKFAEALVALSLGTSKRQAYGYPVEKPFAGLFAGFGSGPGGPAAAG